MKIKVTFTKFIITIMMILVITGCLFGCGSNSSSVYTSLDSTYHYITSVENLSFGIPLSITNSATAVTQITDEMDYDTNSIYSFKNGTDTYILFCMDELIVLATKGTAFGFQDAENKVDCLNNSPIINTWFSQSGKKFSYQEETSDTCYKIIADVTAEVVVTNELYGDYVGKLAVIETGSDEWGLFVGVVADSTKDMSEQQTHMVDSITKSMILYAAPEKTEPEYDVVIQEGLKEQEEKENLSEETLSKDNNTKEENTIDEVTISEQTGVMAENNNTDQSSKQEKPNFDEKISMNITNQKNTTKKDDVVYLSDIYDMLQLNKSGYASVLTYDTYQTVIIKADKLYTGEKAVNLIKQYCQNRTVPYDYFTASDGCSWNAIHYTVDSSNCSSEGYMNIKLRGLDGEELRFRGIKYSKRTHDIKISDTEYYCFYEVPNGCEEYVLECGEGNINNTEEGIVSAYYMINIKNAQ